jgi:hypothetical protein
MPAAQLGIAILAQARDFGLEFPLKSGNCLTDRIN